MGMSDQNAAPSKGSNEQSMMAWRVHKFGPPDVMAFERIDRPLPGPGEVLLRVCAIGCVEMSLPGRPLQEGRSHLIKKRNKSV